MRARHPTERLMGPLLAAGAAGVVAMVPVGIALVGDFPAAVMWCLPFVVGYAGGVIAVRGRPESLASRRLLAFGAISMVWIAASDGLLLAFDVLGPRWWLGPANVVIQIVGLALPVSLLALLAIYPDGLYQRRYEHRLVVGFSAAAIGVPLALLVAAPVLEPAWVFQWNATSATGLADFPALDSPIHLGALAFLAEPLRAFVEAGLGLIPLTAAIVVVLRHRRLRAEERQQIRWPMYGVLAVALLPIEEALWAAGWLPVVIADVIEIAALIALPAAMAIGLVRPDLFDIGRAVRRTLVYLPLWLVIAGAYAGVAAALGLAASGEGLQVAIGVTIVATILFEPARRALLARASRLAYGESLSGEEMLRRLGATLEHTLDIEQLAAGIAATAREGLGVAWTRISVAGLTPLTDGVPGPAPVATAPLVHAGERVGELECGPRVAGGVLAPDRELLGTLARQAALALHNARLASELGVRLEEIREQAEELAASRSRIVAAEEAARRQIGRDIHDGAQQELVALIARLALARNQLGRDPSRLDATFGDLQSEARQALENLRRFAAGIHPPVLSDRGLVEAVESRAARLPVGVTIECDPEMREARFGEAVEGAAYFFVSEALTNALKHSGGERLRVRMLRPAGALEIEVSDDGAGFDPGVVARSGLGGLADRLEALGGSLAVDSAPGRGTRVSARLPVPQPAAV